MTLGEAIYAKATSTPALVALIEQRIYPISIQETVRMPHVIWQAIAATPATTHNEPAQKRHTLVQFACFAGTYEEAVAVREAVIAAFDNVTLATGDIGILEDAREDFDEASDLYRADADLLF